ncbi:MAG: hypothetical protein ACOY0R_00570 [Chloroflexota bacterium]
MQTFIRENKGKLTFLLSLVLCLVGLRTVNIHQVWYYLTPWQDLGAPPKPAERITRIDLPGEDGSLDEFVYVKVSTGDFFGCCGLAKDASNGWVKLDRPYTGFYDIADAEENACIERIEVEWGFREDLQGAKNHGDAGQCFPHTYAVYQIKQDGSIWKKLVSEDKPRLFKEVSFEFVFFVYLGYLVFLAFAWIRENHIDNVDNQQAERGAKPVPVWLLLTGLVVLALGAVLFHFRTDIDRLVRNEFTGEYVRSIGGLWRFQLNLHDDLTFYAKITPDSTGPMEITGQYMIEHGKIQLSASRDNIFTDQYKLVPIRWGERKYLIEEPLIPSFCKGIRFAKSRKNATGIAYLHPGDWNLPAEGEPRFMDGRKACP